MRRTAPFLAAALLLALSASGANPFAGAASGSEVTAEGVVHNVSILSDGRVAFDVRGEVPFLAVFEDASMIAPVDFEDALVSIAGTLELRDGADGGPEIMAEDVASVRTIVPPPEDPYSLPVVDISEVSLAREESFRHRLHARGVVTSSRSADAAFVIYSGGAEIVVRPSARKAQLPKVGDIVDVCAFLEIGGDEPAMNDALVKVIGHDESRLPPYWTAGRVWALMGIVVLSLLVVGLAALVLLRRFERERYNATRRERLRLSHDLHDNLQQLLAATMFRLDAAQSLFDCDPKAAKEQLGWAKKAVEGTQAGLRSVLWDLQEESEGPDSLTGLVRYAVGRMPHWKGCVTTESSGREPSDARSFGGRFLMIIQEAVWNALMRGRASNVRIRLFFRRGLVRLIISDDGAGFDAASAPGVAEGHLGLSSMRQRAEEIGGRFSVKSEIGRGTSVIVEVPCE